MKTRTATLLFYTILILIFVAYWTIYVLWPAFHARYLQGEDHIIEWITFLGFAAATIIGFLTLKKHHRSMSRLARAYMLFLFIFALVCAGEEVSWGQRIFGFKTPEKIEKINEQQEFNMHNLHLKYIHPKGIFTLAVELFGIVTPVIFLRGMRRSQSGMRRFISPPALVPAFIIPELIGTLGDYIRRMNPPPFSGHLLQIIRSQGEELQEMYWSLSLLAAFLFINAAWRHHAATTRKAPSPPQRSDA